jgi:ATP-dependent DNA helicase RecG
MELFTQIYRPNAVATDVIEENHRPLTHQLASLRLFDLAADCPTNGGVLLLGKDVLSWLPHAYVQYVRMDGVSMADEPVLEKQFVGDLFTVSRGLNDFLTLLVAERPVRHNLLQERMVSAYPEVALRELLMNAILHRSYEMPSPVRFLEFTDRIEIQNPGPLFGPSNERNFPAQTSYRNPTVAEALKNLGFINGFGRGVIRAQ